MSADDIFNAAVAIAREVVDERSIGVSLLTILNKTASHCVQAQGYHGRLISFTPYQYEQVASEFAAPYLARIAELESTLLRVREETTSLPMQLESLRAIRATLELEVSELQDAYGSEERTRIKLSRTVAEQEDRIAKLEAENKSLRDAAIAMFDAIDGCTLSHPDGITVAVLRLEELRDMVKP